MYTSNVYKQYRHYCDMVDRDSSVGVATRYGLDGPGIESALVKTGPGAHRASHIMDTGSFPGVQRPGHGVDHPSHLPRRVKKEYSYTSIPSLGLQGRLWGDHYLYLLRHVLVKVWRTQTVEGATNCIIIFTSFIASSTMCSWQQLSIDYVYRGGLKS